jgi:surface protein
MAMISPDILAGTYTRAMALTPEENDSMMSVNNKLSRSDTANATRTPTEDEPFVEFYPWLNAPDPIRRENIKSIEFKNGKVDIDSYVDFTKEEAGGLTQEESDIRNAVLNARKAGYIATDQELEDIMAGKKVQHAGCWDISEKQTRQVVACYKEVRHNGQWTGWDDFATWFAGLFKSDECAGVVDNASTTEVNEEDECIASASEDVPLNIYNITIWQEGGVRAPKDSRGLFYYTGQNTDYCVYGGNVLVDNRLFDRYTTIPAKIIPIVGGIAGEAIEKAAKDIWIDKVLDKKKAIEEEAEKRAAEGKPVVEKGFFEGIFSWVGGIITDAVDRSKNEEYLKKFLNHCHEDFIDKESTIDLSNFLTDSVTDMSHIFDGTGFSDINGRIAAIKDTDFFNTDSVEDMSFMFANITHRVVGGAAGKYEAFDSGEAGMSFSSVKKMDGMFSNSNFDPLTMGGDTENVESMNSMFSSIGEEGIDSREATTPKVHIEGLKTTSVKDMGFMFQGAYAEFYASPDNFTTSNVESMAGMFSYMMDATSLNLDLSHFDTSKVTDMSLMFCNGRFSSVNLSSFNTSNVVNMAGMFSGVETNSLDISNFDTSKVSNMMNMFSNTNVRTIKFGNGFKTGEVTNMSGMFSNSQFDSVAEADFGVAPIGLETAKVMDMNHMFFNAKNLDFIKLTSFDTVKVTDMSYMFANFKIGAPSELTRNNLENIKYTHEQPTDEDDWNKENKKLYVLDASHTEPNTDEYLKTPYDVAVEGGRSSWIDKIFEYLYDVVPRELSNWRNTVVENPGERYPTHYNTRTRLDLTSFKTENVVNMEGMFLGAQYPGIDIDYNNFDTSKVENMAWMYAMVNATKFNFTGKFNTEKVKTMEGMFAGTWYDHTLSLSYFSSKALENARFMFAYSDIYGITETDGFCSDSAGKGGEITRHIKEHAATVALDEQCKLWPKS